MTKHFFSRHSRWIIITGLAALGLIIALSWLVYRRFELQFATTAIGGILGLIYFVQKQSLDELKLFHDLFTKFNERYDMLNDTLNGIARKAPDSDLTDEESNRLNDYFNLYVEEFFFHNQGYIYDEVWKTWVKGMQWFCIAPVRIGESGLRS